MNRFETLKKTITDFGNQLDIYGDSIYTILKLIEEIDNSEPLDRYVNTEYIKLGDNQKALYNNAVDYLNSKITIETFKYRVYGIKPLKDKTINKRPNLEVRDIITERITNTNKDEYRFELFTRDGAFVKTFNSLTELGYYLNIPINTIYTYIRTKGDILNKKYKIRVANKNKL